MAGTVQSSLRLASGNSYKVTQVPILEVETKAPSFGSPRGMTAWGGSHPL